MKDTGSHCLPVLGTRQRSLVSIIYSPDSPWLQTRSIAMALTSPSRAGYQLEASLWWGDVACCLPIVWSCIGACSGRHRRQPVGSALQRAQWQLHWQSKGLFPRFSKRKNYFYLYASKGGGVTEFRCCISDIMYVCMYVCMYIQHLVARHLTCYISARTCSSIAENPPITWHITLSILYIQSSLHTVLNLSM